MYEQEVAFYSFYKQSLTNDQWYERFNTKLDIGSAIGVTRQRKVLLEYFAQESNIKYDEISIEEQDDFKEYSEEIYLSYVFLRQSGKQHNKLNTNIQNDSTTGDDSMPKKLHMTLQLLDNYTKNKVLIQPTQEGVKFSQKGDRNKKKYEHYDKQFCKYKKCYNCGNTGHP